MSIKIINGNILDSTEQYIAHQCNCVSNNGAAGLARTLFDHYPYADVYSGRPLGTHKPGDIVIRGNGKDERYVIALMAQYYPGGPWNRRYRPNDYVTDSPQAREAYFAKCLSKLLQLNMESIAFPYKIGCGIAGGNWDNYSRMLDDFNKESKNKINIVIYNYGM